MDDELFNRESLTAAEIATNDQTAADMELCMKTWVRKRVTVLTADPTLEWYSIISANNPNDPDEMALEDATFVEYMRTHPEYHIGLTMYLIHRIAKSSITVLEKR